MSITAARRALSRLFLRPRAERGGDEGMVRVPLADWDQIVGALKAYDEKAAGARQTLADENSFSVALNRAADEVVAVALENGSHVDDAINLAINLADAYSAHPEWTQDQAIENAYEEEPDEVRSWV